MAGSPGVTRALAITEGEEVNYQPINKKASPHLCIQLALS